MADRDLIVIGASAGGLEPLRELVAAFPKDFRAAVLVVMHVPAMAESVLPAILTRAGPLLATRAEDGEPWHTGHIYVAPPDRHLSMFDGRLRVTAGPRLNGHRPAVDALFRSAARWGGPRVIGVILSGSLDDGASGLLAIKRSGGVTFAQDPNEARHPAMPKSAIERTAVDHILPTIELAKRIVSLVGENVPDPPVPVLEDITDDLDLEPEQRTDIRGPASSLTCPACHGALWEVKDEELVRYRCRVGHAYHESILADAQSEMVEEALWIAYRALEEKAALSRRLADRANLAGHADSGRRHTEAQEDALRRALVLHDLLTRGVVGGGNES